jgi:sugar phosphate isomerase/epimerase
MSGNDWLAYIYFLSKKCSDPAESEEERSQASVDFLAAIGNGADDPAADPEDRWIARELQGVAAAHARLGAVQVITVLSGIVGSDSADPEEREEAKRYLKHVAERLREQESDNSK